MNNRSSSAVILCEKPSQARNLKAALGTRYGEIVAARGHLLTLKEPQEVNPDWVKWSTAILCPDKPYGKKTTRGSGKPLAEIRQALQGARTLIIATDCDREGLVIGREIAEHLRFRGTILRAIFGAEDKKTLIEAFQQLVPISKFDGLYAAGKAREQADQIFNLSLTRTVSVHLGGHGKAIGIGRVRTPTLGIVCQREMAIRNFTPLPYYVVEAHCQQQTMTFVATYVNKKNAAPKTGNEEAALDANEQEDDERDKEDSGNRISDKKVADAIARAVKGWEGLVRVQKRPLHKAPPRPFDLSSLQGHMGARYKWPAKKTLQVAQTLYADLKLITYPRAECRYLPESQVPDALPLREALLQLEPLGLPLGLAKKPVIRQGKGKKNHYSDAGIGDSSHHAIQPNVKMVAEFASLWQRCNQDQQRLAQTIFLAFLEQTSEDALLEQTRISFTVDATRAGLSEDALFQATGQIIKAKGWLAIRGDTKNSRNKSEEALLPPITDGSSINVTDSNVATKMTKPPGRFTEGGIILAMRDAWKYIPDTNQQMRDLRQRLKDTSGIGTPATRDSIIESLVTQGQIKRISGSFHPTPAGMALFEQLGKVAPELVDPGLTALWEYRLETLNQAPDAEARWWAEVGMIANTAAKARDAILTLPDGGLREVFASTLGASRPSNNKRKSGKYRAKNPGRGAG